MQTDVGCKTLRRGGGRLAVGHVVAVALLAVVMTSMQGCGSDNDGGDGGGNPILDFGGRFLKAARCVREEVKGFMDEIHSGKEVWEERKKLQSSTTERFPSVQLVSEQGIADVCGKDKAGQISYNGIKIPDLSQIELYVPYTQDEESFFLHYQVDVTARLLDFGQKSKRLEKLSSLTGANVHGEYHDVAVEVNKLSPEVGPSAMWTQGHSSNGWQSDDYAGQLIGYTLLASLLEPTGNANEWVLDLLGDGNSQQPVQVKKREILAMFPHTLLKSRATFTAGGAGPTLVKIEVQTPQKLEGSSSSGVQWEIIRDEALMEFTSGSGVRWEVAKKVFFSGALYVLECYHTGIHLYQGSVIAAIRNSVPAGTTLGESVKPQTQQVLLTLFEQVAALHANHGVGLEGDGTIFMGGVWPTRDHNLVWDTTRDIARYYVDYSPAQFLGEEIAKPDWWAGMSSTFIAPIEKFANAVATQVFAEGLSEEWLTYLQAKLEESGLVKKPASPVDVTTVEGLGKFLTNMIFVPSICHTHMYSTRESFTPLFFASTQEFQKYLGQQEEPGNMQNILEEAFPTVDKHFHQLFFIAYGTASGFAPYFNENHPELGDGPYYGPFLTLNSTVANALMEFKGELGVARASVMLKFGEVVEGSRKFVPAYFYPKSAAKPFGYGLTQTTYI